MAVIGITDLDIVDKEADVNIYGRATGDGACVLSSFHFEAASRVFLSTAAHESLHVFGLDHCDYFRCVMNPECDADRPESVEMLLCPICRYKLQHCLKFNVNERYAAMKAACAELKLAQDEEKIVQQLERE